MVIHVNFQRRASESEGEEPTTVALWQVSDPAVIPEVGQVVLLESEEGHAGEYRVEALPRRSLIRVYGWGRGWRTSL